MKLLQFFYRGILTGMPSIVYNPITRTNIHVPFNVLPNSLYINYRLTPLQKTAVENYISEKNKKFHLEPIAMNPDKTDLDYYLSLNIYNCTSPVFLNDKETTRFEINTYVNDECKKGTLIMDYLSNELSIDPIYIFKRLSSLSYTKDNITGKSLSQNIFLKTNIQMDPSEDPCFPINDDLIDYSDTIFYMNGIYDKLFYDTSLTKASLKIPILEDLQFTYLNITFDQPDSVFYFENQIDFVGGVWYNIFKKPRGIRCSVN